MGPGGVLTPEELGELPTGAAPSGDAAETASQLEAGELIADRYRVVSLLGVGGMGAVYRARDETLDSDVVLKIIRPEFAASPDLLARFQNEARLGKMITHQNVCRLYEFVEADGFCFLTMEYVAGEPLDEWLNKNSPAPIEWTVDILGQVAAGLAAAHAKGVVHRDLKPANVLIAADGNALVLDFGIAKKLGGSDLTQQGYTVGTPDYMAPEQLAGGEIDARTDVYALGLLAHLMLVGSLPGVTFAQTEHGMHRQRAAHVPLRGERPDVSAALDRLVSTCLETDPELRFRDARAVVDALGRLDDDSDVEGSEDTPVTAAETVESVLPGRGTAGLQPKVVWQRRLPLWILGLVAAVLLARQFGDSIGPAKIDASQVKAQEVRFVVHSLAAKQLDAADAWLSAGVQRLVVNELQDAWGIQARSKRDTESDGDATVVRGSVTRDVAGRIELRATVEQDGKQFHLGPVTNNAPREAAIALTAMIVKASVPIALRGPSPTELARAGTRDPRAWRLWRRARRASLMSVARARELARAAIARDATFAQAHMVLAATYSRADRDGERAAALAIKHSTQLGVMPRLKIELWHAYFTKGWTADLEPKLTRLRKLAEKDLHFQLMYARLLLGAQEVRQGLAELEAISETWPTDARAFKLLAQHYLGMQRPVRWPRSLQKGLSNARRAVELAPADATARALLAVALVLHGDADKAVVQVDLATGWERDNFVTVMAGIIYALNHHSVGVTREARRAQTDAAYKYARRLARKGGSHKALADLLHGLIDIYRGLVKQGTDALATIVPSLLEQKLTGEALEFADAIGSYALQMNRMGLAVASFAHVKKIAGTYYGLGAKVDALFKAMLDHQAGTKRSKPGQLVAGATALVEEARKQGQRPQLDALRHLALYAAYFEKNWAQVIVWFRELTAADTAEYSVRYMAARAYAATGARADAKRFYSGLARHPLRFLQPYFAQMSLYELGRLHELDQQPTLAIAAYDELLSWQSKNADNSEGAAYTNARKRKAALETKK